MRSKGVSDGDIAQRLADAAGEAIIGESPVPCLKALVEGGLKVTTARATDTATRITIPVFHVATQYGRADAVAFLLEQGCDPKEADIRGFLPHHGAARVGHLHMIQWLQTVAPLDINALTTKQPIGTMLHMAAEGGHMAVVKWLAGQSADARMLSTATKSPTRASVLAEAGGHTAVAAYLREQEQAADARERAEQAAAEAAARQEQAEAEAAVRRARNERRRQKKNGKARRRAAEGVDAGEEEEEEEEGGGEEEQEEQEQELAAAMAGLSAGDAAAAAGAEEMETEAAVDEPQAAAAPGATDPEEEEDGMLEAAITVSLSVDRPPPLDEYVEADAPDGLLCPISVALLDDPVVLVADGETYSRAAIEQHFAFCRERSKPLTAPSTNIEITDPTGTMLVPNVRVRGQVLEYKAAKERAWAEAERRWRNAAGDVAN